MNIKDLRLAITVPHLAADAPGLDQLVGDIQRHLSTYHDVVVAPDANGTCAKLSVSIRNLEASAGAIEQLKGSLRSYTQWRAQWVGVDPSKVFKSRRYPGIDVAVEWMDEIKPSA